MNRLEKVLHNTGIRKRRVRFTISGTPTRPRLTVHISNQHVSAQVIDDTAGKTLAQATTVGSKDLSAKTMVEKAAWVGAEIAKKAKAAKVSKVAYDRNGRIYHGRVKALAEAAREAGLEF